MQRYHLKTKIRSIVKHYLQDESEIDHATEELVNLFFFNPSKVALGIMLGDTSCIVTNRVPPMQIVLYDTNGYKVAEADLKWKPYVNGKQIT
jgi:hypothetical protein